MKQISKKIFHARQGAPFAEKDAEMLGKYIEGNRLFTPELMLEDAKRINSPLNKYVEWNRTDAAVKYQISQMKNVINHISCEIVYINSKPIMFDRGFLNVMVNQERRYIPITEGLSDETIRKQILSEGYNSLTNWRIRYGAYKEFLKIIEVYDEFNKTWEN